MKTRDLNVAEQLWDDEKADIFGRIYEPENPNHALPLLFCIPGGTYNHRYWDLDVVGGGFSFAEELTSRGYFVVAIDNLGTGASSRPVHRAGLAELATAAAAALEAVRAALPPKRVVGIGHSMGGYALVTQQAMTRGCDAIAVLGSAIGPSTLLPIPDDVIRSAREGPDARNALAAESEPLIPSDYVPSSRRAPGMNMFHLDDVPAHVLDADVAQTATSLPSAAASESSVPWFTVESAASIDVPVLLTFGELDVSPAPHEEPSYFTKSSDVTLLVLAGSAHCHNMATTRRRLWDRIDHWTRAVIWS